MLRDVRVEVVGPPVVRGSVVGVRIVEIVKEWEFPKDRFVEYEPKDERWCRLLGIGREVVREHVTYQACAAIVLEAAPDRFSFESHAASAIINGW